MTVVNFTPQDKHLDNDMWGLFAEEWKIGGSDKYQIGHPWSFELEDVEVETIMELCKKYHLAELEQEAYCIFYKMKMLARRKMAAFTREQWDKIKDSINSLEKWLDASQLNEVFDFKNIEYLKVKPKESKLCTQYEGILLDFICQAVVEKYERDRESLRLAQQTTLRMIMLAKENKPNQLRDRQRHNEEHLAYYTFKFLKSESNLSNSDIDRFGSELIKLAGFVMPPDESDITANVNDYMANFKKWRLSQEKYMRDHGLIN